MSREEIIKFFLRKGYQLDSKTLEFFSTNQDKMTSFLEWLKETEFSDSTITYKEVQAFLETTAGIKVIRDFSTVKKTFTVDECVHLFRERYEKIREILSKRIELVNLISINKISPRTRKFSLVVMVKEKSGEGKLTVEDLTGVVDVYFRKEIENELNFIVPDEVLGLLCRKEGDTIYVNNIVWPDIPFKKKIARTKDEINCLFIANSLPEKERYEKFLTWFDSLRYKNLVLFLFNPSNSEVEEKFLGRILKNSRNVLIVSNTQQPRMEGVINVGNPSIVEIQSVSMFLCYNLFEKYIQLWNTTPVKTLLNLIRKRHLDPEFSGRMYEKDQFFLDIIPDIFVIGGCDEVQQMNYKGVTIFSTGSLKSNPIFWLLNLKTRETIKLDLRQIV